MRHREGVLMAGGAICAALGMGVAGVLRGRGRGRLRGAGGAARGRRALAVLCCAVLCCAVLCCAVGF